MSRTLRVHKKLNPSDFRSDDEIIADIANSKGGDTFRQRDPEFEAEFKGMRERNMPGLIESSTKGFKRGVDMTQALGFGLGAWGADAVGADSVRDWAIEGMEEQFAEAEENKAFTTFGEAETFRDYADWAAGGIGELLPNVLTTIAASVATAGVGGVAAVAGFGGRKALTKLVSKELAEKFAEKGGAKYVNQMTRKELEFESRKMAGQLIRDEAAKKGVKRTADNVLGIRAKEMAAKKAAGKRLGGQLGAIGSGVGLNTGEIYGQFAEDLDNPNVSRAERVLATGGMGFLAGLLDSALPLLAVNKFLPDATKKGMMSEVMEAFPEWLRKNKKKGALLALTGGSVTEGSIEALQELLGYTAGLVDETREFSWEEVKPSLIEAGALGALGGGFFGLAGAGATMVSKDKASQQEIEEEQVNLINAKRKAERERTDNIPVITEFQVGDVFHEASTEATEDTEASVGRQMTVKEVDENGNATLHVANHDNTDQLMEVSVAEFNDHLSQAPVTRVRLEEGEKPLKIASYQDMKNDMLRSELRRLGLKKVQTDDDKAQVENLLSQVTGSPIIEQEYQGLRKEVDMERIEVLKAKVENGNTLTDVDYEDIGRLVGLYPDQTKELQTKADVALGEVTKDMSEIQDATALEEQDAQNLVTGDSIKKLNKIRKTKGGRLVIADIRRLKKLMKKQFTLTGEQSLTPVEEIQLESGRQAYPETARAYEETLNNEKSVKDAKVAELKANPKSSMKWEELLALSGLEGIYKSGTQKREGGIPASKAQLIDHINFVNGHGGKEFTHAISSKNQMALSDTPEEWRGYLSSNYSPDRLFEFIRQVEHMVSTGVLNETETKAANDAVRHAKKIVSKKGLVNYTLADKQGVPVSDIVRPVETTDVSTEVSATPPPVIKGTATVIEVDEALDIPTLKKNGTLVKSRAGNRGLAVMDKRTGEVTIRAVRGLDSSDEKSSRVDRWTVSSGESASNVLTTILAGNSIVGTNGESLTTPAAVLKQMGKTKKSGPWWLLPPTEGDKNLRNQLIPIMESLGWDKETEGKISKNVGKTTKILLAEFYNKAYEGNGVPIAWVHFDNKPDDYVWVGTRKAFDNMVRASKATHDFYTKLSTEKEYLYAAVQTATQREIQDLQNEAKEVGQPMTDAQAKTLIENPDRQEQLRKEGVEEKPAYLEANKGRFAQLLRNLKAFAKTELEESGGQPLLRHEEEHMLIGAVKASLNVHKYQNMLADLLADNRAQLRDLLYLGKVNPKGNRKFLGMFTGDQIDILMDISAGEVDGEHLSQEQNFIRKAKEFTKKNRVSPVVHIKGMQKAGQSAMGEVTSSLDKEDENGLSALDKTEDKSKEFEDELHGRLFDSEGKLHSEIHGEIEEYKSGTYNDELSADQIGKILGLSEEEIAARLKKGEKLVLPEGQTLTDAQAIEAYLVKNSNESIIGDFLRSLIASRLTGEAKDALDNDPTLLREVNEQLIGDTEMSQQASEQLVDILTTSFNKGKADEVSVEQLESEAVSRTLGDTPVTPLLPEGSIPEGGSPIGETPTVESTPEGTGDVGASTDQVVETPTQKTVRKAKAKGVPTSVAKTKVVQTTDKTIEEVNAELDIEEKVEDVLAQTLDDSLDMERRLLDERETATPARQKEIDKWVSDRIDAVERLTQMLPAITDPKERLNILEGFASEFAVVEETTFREPEGEVITSTTVEEIVEEDGLADPGGITTINRVNRKNFKNSIMLAFNLSVEEASAVAQLMEGVAQTWAERTGRTAEEWYTEYIDGLERVPVAEQVDMGRYFNNANGQIGFAKTVRDGKPHYSAIISAFENSDVTTAMHELFHLIRMTTITEKQRITLEGWLAKKKLLPEDDGSWTVAMEEMAARAFEKYLRTGKLPTTVSEDLKAVFKDMKRWFMKAYKNLVNSPLGDVGIIPNDVINVFNEILVGADEEAIMDETIVEPKVDLTPVKKTVKFTKPRQAVSLKSFAKEVSNIFTSLDVSGIIAGVKADRVQETEGIFLEEDDGDAFTIDGEPMSITYDDNAGVAGGFVARSESGRFEDVGIDHLDKMSIDSGSLKKTEHKKTKDVFDEAIENKDDTRGKGQQYHGTSNKIKSIKEYTYSENNYYGQGFYTSDAMDVIEGYTKKGKGKKPTIYKVTPSKSKLYDMEKVIDSDLETALANLQFDIIDDSLEYLDSPNLRSLYDEIRAESSNQGMSRIDVQEVFDAVSDVLREQGFNGLRHTGGLRTNKKAHNVEIYFDPKSDISIEEVGKEKPKPKPGFFQDPNAVEEPVTKATKRTKKAIAAENEKLVKALITKHVVGKVPKTASKDAMIEQFQIALGQDESLLEAGGNLFLDLFTQLDGLRTEGITLAQDPVTTIDDVRTDRGIEKSLNVTRDNFKGIMGRMFGLSDEQASAFSVITDGIATTWADKNNLAPEEWYSRFIQGVQRIPREIQRQMRDPQGLDTLLQQSAYHGASVVNGEIFPYFSEDAIGGIKGTGEGAIAYGWGMYFTQDIEIARMYAENASRRLDRSKSGKLSEIIHIPEVKTIFDRGISMKTDTFLELTETDAFKKFMEDPDRYTDLDTIDGDELVAEVDDSLSEVFEVFMDWVSVADGDDGLPAGVDGFISFLSDESNKKYNIMPGGWIIIHDIVARVSGQLSPDLFSELVPEVNKYALKAELWANRQETLLLHDTSNPEIVAQLRQFIADNPDFVPNLSTRSQKELSRSTQIEFRASEIPNDVLLEAAAIDHGMDIAPPTTRDFVAHYLTGELKKNESDRDDVVKDLTARGFDMDTYAGFNAALNRVPDDVLSGSREKLMDTHSARVAEAQAVVDEWVKADTVVDTSGVEGEALRDFLKSQKKRIPTIGQVFGREYSSFQTLSKDGFVSDRLTHIHGGGLYDGMDADVSRFAEDSLATAEYVSKTMLAAGIDGIKYLDGNSRGHRPTGLNWISNIAPVNGDTLSLAFAPDVDFADRGADADTIKRQLDNVLKDFLSDWTRETIATTEEAVTELEWLVSDEAVETFDDRAYRQPSTMRIGDKDKFTYLLNQLKSGNVEVSATERKYNFVVFDDSEIWINDLEVLLQGADLQSAKALIKIGQNGQGMFSAFEGADITSAFHEMFHLTRRTSLDMDENQVLEDWLRSMGHVPEGGMWTRAMEETSARAFEAYLRSGEAPTLQLKEVFQKIAKWFKEIYSSDEFKDIGIIPDEVKKVFDEIIAGTPDSAPVHDNRTYLAQSAEQKIADSMSEGERNENLATRDGVVTVEGDPTSREGSRLAYENEVDLDKKEAVDWINVAFNTELKALLFNIQDKVKSMTPARVGQLIGQLKPDETIASIIERTESADGKTLENLPERWSNLSASKLETKFSRMESRTVTIIDQLNAEIEDHRQDFDDAFEGRSNIINNPEAMEHYNFSAKKFIDRIVSSLAHSQGLSVAKSSIEATIKGIEGQLEDRTVTRYLNKFKDIKEPALLLQAVSALDIDWSNVTAKEALDIVKNYKTNANYTALKGQTQTQSQKDALAGFGLMTDEARAFAVAYAMSHSIEMNVLRLRLSETIGRFDELKRRMKGLIGMNEEELLKKEAELIEELKEKSVLQDQIQLQLIGYEKRLKRTVALQLRKKKKIKDLEATLEQIQTQNRQYRKQLGVVGTFRGAPGEHFHSWNPKTGEFEFPKFEYSGKNSKAYESAFRNNEIYLKDKSNEAKDPVLYATVERTNTQLKYSIFKTEAQNVKMRTVSFLISSSQKIFRAIGYNEGIRLSNKMLALSRDILVHGQRFDALAQKWESLESDFRKAAGFTSALAFKRDVLVPIYASLESEIGILSEQGGLNHGYKVLQSRLAKLDTGGTVNEAQLKKAFDKYFIQTKSISQELNALREATGSTITDPRTQVDATESFRAEDPAIVAKAKIKGKLKDTKRDLERLVGLDLGWITMPRMIKTGELSRVVDLMFANGWGTQSTVRNVPDLYWWQEVRTTPDGKEVVVNTIEETFENPDITLEEKLETVRAGFNKVDASKSEDLDLYTSFYLPIIEHHTSLFENATTDEVRQAWERSGGDVVNFSIILANNVRASDKTQTEQVHRYLNTFLNQFQTYAKIAKNSKDQADWTDTSTNNSFMADARTTRNIPQEYVTYTDFDKGSMSRHVMKLVSMQHFGKNFETFDAIYNSLILNIEKDIADASRKGDNPRVVELGEKLKKARKERSNYMNWYTKSETSPNQEVRLFSEVMRTAAIAMLAQPKSAMNNLVSLTDFFVTFKGVNNYSSSAVKSAISNMVKSPFWSFLETFGIQRTINRESKIIMDVTANLHRQSVSLKEQVAERGFGDQSEDDTSSKAIRTLRKAQRVISHPFGTFVKEGDRQEIALSANIFDYSARASNAAIAEGQMEAYNMMIADLQSMDDAISVDFDRLSKKDQERLLKKAGINVDTYHYLNNRWFDMSGQTMSDLVKDVRTRREAGKPALSEPMIHNMVMIAMDEVAMNADVNTRPSAFMTGMGPTATLLLGWPVRKMNQLGAAAVTEEGEIQYKLSLKFIANMSFYSSIGIAFTLLTDIYDEEFRGRASSLRTIEGTPSNMMLAAIQRAARIGSGGLGLELLSQTLIHTDSGLGQRGISADRIVAVSMLNNAVRALANAWQQGGVSWQTVGAPLTQAFTVSAVHYMEVANHVTGGVLDGAPLVGDMFEWQRANTERVTIGNILRREGNKHQIELRKMGAGSPTPIGMHVRNMENAMYAGNQKDFIKHYKYAIQAAIDAGEPDPARRVYSAWTGRNPATVFKSPTEGMEKMPMLLADMRDRDQARRVMSAITKYQQHTAIIKPARKSTSVASSARKRMEALGFRLG